MKKNLQLAAVAVCLFFLSLAGVNAQTLVASWEAEDFIGMGFFANAISTSTDPSISGGKFLGKGKFSQSNSIFYYVNVAQAGWYNLTAYYMTKVTDTSVEVANGYVCIGVRVNNQDANGIKIFAEDATATENTNPGSKSVSVYLNQGVNKIRIGQNKAFRTKENGTASVDGKYLPPLDKFELYSDFTKVDPAPADAVNNPEGNYYEQRAADYLTSDINTFASDGADYTMFNGLFSIECLSSPENLTVNNLIDNNPATSFVSNNDEETFLVTYPASTGVFCLRSIEALNPNVAISLIERSKDNVTFDSGFGRASVFGTSNTISNSTIGIWSTTDEPDPTNKHQDYIYYKFTIKKIPGSEDAINIPDLRICGSFFNYVDLTETSNGSVLVEAVETTSGSFESNYLVNVVDNNFGSKCSYINGTNGVLMNITYTFNDYAKVNYYTVTTAGGVSNTLQRDAVSWRLEGWNNEGSPVVLDEVTDHSWANVKRAQVLRKIDVPNIYKYYKLYITKKATETSNGVHVGEFQVFGTLETSLTTGTQTPENNSNISVYASEKSIVINNPANQVVLYQIYNITGKQVKSGMAGASQHEINMQNGMYLIKTRVGNTINTSKVIIY
jgi:hypothetical protein